MNIHTKQKLFVLILCSFGSTSAIGSEILSRQEWGAKPAIESREPNIKIVTKGGNRVSAENKMTEREDAVYLTVHHTGDPARRAPFMESLRAFQANMQGGYDIKTNTYVKHVILGDIPYHYFINASGEIAEGREIRFTAYSNTTYKTPIGKHITVVLEGNFESTQPSKNQINALTNLLECLAKQYNIRLSNIGYHRAVAIEGTVCPGKNLINKMGEIKKALSKRGVN